MTKNQALAQFKDSYCSFKEFKASLKADYIAVKTNWGCFTDSLCKGGYITEKQYNSWLFPFKRK